MKLALLKKLCLNAVICSVICGLAFWAFRYYQLQNYSFKNSTAPVSEIVRINVPQPSLKPEPIFIYFNNPIANLNKIGRELNKEIKIYPAIKGNWVWLVDSCLKFQPETSLIPDTEYEVTLSPEIFSPDIRVKNNDFSFKSPSFQGQNISSDFVENPQNGNKSVIATFSFNYPLNPQGIKDKISITTVDGSNYGFTYKLDKENTVLHIISDPVKLTLQENFATITVDGVTNIYNKKPLKEKISAKVRIPSSSTFFQVKSISSTITRNKEDNDNPEQIAVIKFSTAVNPENLKNYFDLYFTPEYCYAISAAQNNNKTDTLNMRKLNLTMVPSIGGNKKTHIFKYDETAPKGCLIAVIRGGLTSSEGYVLPQDIVSTVEYVSYPREVNIVASGAIMPLSGNHEAAFVTRGVNNLHISVARINEDNLNHLVTQTSGDFAHPFFTHYDFDENNISEVFEKNLTLNLNHPAKANYASLDLNEYFKNRKGVFIIRAYGTSSENYRSNTDTRLIVITDLGIVVKEDINKQHNVFVSDISKGEPVEGAKVEVLGKNGLPVLSAQTDRDGLAIIPDFSDFKNDKQAVVYKISKNNDLSFLPIEQSDRRLNLSRYDIGGQYDTRQGEYDLRGSIFSDRGIYRPGENAYFGIILRQNDLTVPLQLPLVVEITNPNGDLVASHNIITDNMGLMSYEYNIAQTAPTGIYNISLYLKNKDNQRYFISSTPFKVDEFMPDNLRIKAAWQDTPTKGWTTAKKLTATVDLQNLYGAPAVGNEIKASYTLTPTVFRFKEYAGYVFLAPETGPGHRRETFQNDLATVKTDDKGKASINIDISQFEFGPYELRLFMDGLENGGGRGVKISLATLASENDFLIGWKADDDLNYIHKNSERKIDFVALNNQLETIDKDNLILKVLRRETVSDLVEMPNGTYGYKTVQKETELSKREWTVSATHTTEILKTDEAGDFALHIETPEGKLLAKAEWSVAGAGNITGQIDKTANLGLKLNRNQYTAGDEIEMQIAAPYTGYGLITIEQDKVYAYKWFKTDTPTTVENIKLPNTIEGNAYINVALFRNINSPEIYMSPMSYAATPFGINKEKRKLNIDLNVAPTVKSGQELVINYKTEQDAKIIIYGVNQGILQVARYKLPDLSEIFLPKKALRVITTQIMDLIMPDVRILRVLSSSGGDDSYDSLVLDKNLNPFARKNGKPVAFWSGVLSSNTESKEYRYIVPDEFNGEIKVMAVAVSNDKLGSTEKAVKAVGNFAILPTGPLNVAPKDEFIISVTVGNMVENSGNDYPIEVRVDNIDGFELTNSQSQIVTVSENGETTVKFRFKTLSDIGAKELSFTARSTKSNDIKSHMNYPISIRPATPYTSKFTMGHKSSKFVLKNIENMYPQYRTQQISASSSPLVLASGLFKYLDKFPHYCTEQTVSKAFPAMELLFKYPELVKDIDVYALFNDALAKLQERQTLNGGFSAWTSPAATADPYASIYATHFLVRAKNHGFNVQQGMLNRALAYCTEKAGQAPLNIDDFLPAYATYVLTINGSVTSNYLLNLEEYYKQNYKKGWQSGLAASFMAASYKMLQNNKKADSLFDEYKESDNTLSNAINAYLSATHFPHSFADSGTKKIQSLLNGLSDGNWTTSSAAWSTLALAATDNKENDQSILFNNRKAEKPTPFPTADFTPQTKQITVTANTPFYYVVSQLGFLQENSIKTQAQGMEIQKNLYNQKGEEVNSARLGDELTVVINCRGLQKENIQNVAVVDLLSGGFEVISNSLQSPWTVDTSEIREDRIIAYMTVTPQSGEIRYKVKAIATGTFTFPPVFASALYQPLVRANSAASMIRIDE